jgi:uncharacterized protein YdeI (YjbR/CyaY-like superfamily)
MSFSRRREYAPWIEAARRPETRARRIAKSVAELKPGKT